MTSAGQSLSRLRLMPVRFGPEQYMMILALIRRAESQASPMLFITRRRLSLPRGRLFREVRLRSGARAVGRWCYDFAPFYDFGHGTKQLHCHLPPKYRGRITEVDGLHHALLLERRRGHGSR